jgi:aspartyl-tRNA(Asn)/glutamyl-tRNA(Gln) amidotransferase subunit A
MDLHELSAAGLARALDRGETSSAELVRHLYARIERYQPALNAFLHVTRPLAEAAAEASDRRRRAKSPLSALDGVPVAVKDNIAVAGYPTTCASAILGAYRPVFDATVVERLAAAGLPILGKTNLDEFAMGSSTEHSAFGPVSNPWDLERVPGGSSGGSAAAVAARLAPLALGSDTGGSIRLPAALSGIVGLKPTYGAVSRFGLVAFASSLDQIGPMARTVEDCALLFRAIAGHDPRDATSAPVDLSGAMDAELARPVRGLKVGVVRQMVEEEGIAGETRDAVLQAVRDLEELGVVAGEADLPHMGLSIPTYYVLACAEASSNLARYDGVRYGTRAAAAAAAAAGGGGGLSEMFELTRSRGFGAEVKRRIMLGTFVLSSGYYDAYYGRAQKVRTLIRRDFDAAFERFDLLVGATSPTPAFRKGEKSADPLQMYAADVCTVSVNLAGGPGLTVPCGFTPAGLPLGLQILGRPFDEARILRLASAYQAATDHHERAPRL